jgi:membrane-associated protease RseP (regulator of RpoE activity)
MRKNAALIAGLLLIAGFAGVNHVCAAERTPWLGVYMQELTPELREGMDYRGDGGVILSRVVAGGPAARAGLRNGDVVVRVNSRTVDSPAELQDIVRTARVGQSVSVEVFRDGKRLIVSVWLEARPVESRFRPERPEPPAVSEPPEAPEPPALESRRLPDGKRQVKRSIIRDGNCLDELEGLKELEGLDELDLPHRGAGVFVGSPRGRLGVRIESLSPALGDYFGLKDGKGALVLEVLKDTPAERSGLEAGDVITRVGEEAVANGMDLVSALRGKAGRVALLVVRHGTPRTIEAELEKPEPTRSRIFEDEPGDRPGVQKRIILRKPDRGDLRHELDQLRKQMEELRQRLDEEPGDDGKE